MKPTRSVLAMAIPHKAKRYAQPRQLAQDCWPPLRRQAVVRLGVVGAIFPDKQAKTCKLLVRHSRQAELPSADLMPQASAMQAEQRDRALYRKCRSLTLHTTVTVESGVVKLRRIY